MLEELCKQNWHHYAALHYSSVSQNIKQMFGVGGPKFDQFETIPNNPQQYATACANSGCLNTGEHLSTFQVNNDYCTVFVGTFYLFINRNMNAHYSLTKTWLGETQNTKKTNFARITRVKLQLTCRKLSERVL